jgi:hypothetical protein
LVGAVLKKIKILGFGGPGLKIHVLKKIVAPPLSSKEKAVSIIFLAYGDFEILGKCPKTPKTTYFFGALNGFLAGEPRLGCRKMDFRFLLG